MLSSKFRPRVIPMLYSFYLIVYLICISYFIYSYYIYLYLIIIISFFVCKLLYIGFLLSLILCYFLFYVCCLGDKDRDYIIIDIPLCVIFRVLCLFVFFGIYDNIGDSFHILFPYEDFYFYVLYGIIGL